FSKRLHKVKELRPNSPVYLKFVRPPNSIMGEQVLKIRHVRALIYDFFRAIRQKLKGAIINLTYLSQGFSQKSRYGISSYYYDYVTQGYSSLLSEILSSWNTKHLKTRL